MTDSDRQKVRGYTALLNRLAKRAEQVMLQEDPAGPICEVLVQLFNQYVDEIAQMFDADSRVFAPVQFNQAEPRRSLAEVMFRSEQLAELLSAVFDETRAARFEIPPLPDVSGLVNAERAEQLVAEVEKWARSVGHRAEELSRELSERIPKMMARYTERRPASGEKSEAEQKLRMHVLQRLRDGEVTVDEALAVLGHPPVEDAEEGADRDQEDNCCR